MKGSAEDNIQRITESGCWIWMGYLNNNGYGVTWYEGKRYLAHRLYWKLQNGEIKDGYQACHKCDTPSCVNPNHIFIGTNIDNINDSMKKNRRKNITRNRPSGIQYRKWGSKHKIAKMKIKPDERKEIYNLYKSGGITQVRIAELYNINRATVINILKEIENS